MKKIVRSALAKMIAQSPEELVGILEQGKYKMISFDIFDTLIKRNVPHPKDVFHLLEKKYQINFDKTIRISELRSKAEMQAVQHTGHRDVKLQEIYEEIREIDQAEREWLMREEVRIEKMVCQRWHPMGRIFDWCVDHNIPVILVSDMYLPREVITELLHDAGYRGWKHLYISAEEHANKADGSLFDVVLDKEQLKSEELMHIGDSLRGDCLMPRKKGLKAFLIKESYRKRYFNRQEFIKEKKLSKFSYRIVDSLVKNNIDQYEDFYQRIGYAVVGPLLYGYCKWLANQVRKEHINKIFFLAREGYLLKRGFDLLDTKDIHSDVIQVSRLAVTRPLLHKVESLDELLRMIKFDRSSLIGDILDFCKLDEKKSDLILKKQGLHRRDDISTMAYEKKNELFKQIKPLIDQMSYEQEENIRGYLTQMDFAGRMAICDVGWLGTMQNLLQTMYQAEEMTGYYVGKKELHNKPKVHSYGFLFDNKENHKIFQIVIGTADLFELFFLSTGGSASYYEQNTDGKYICKELPPEQTADTEKSIVELQDAACHFVHDFKRLDDNLNIEMDPYTSSAGYRSFVSHLDSDTLHELREFTFLNMRKRSLVAEHSLGWYVFRPHAFIKDYLNSGCRAIFLQSVFKIPFPYVQFVDYYRRIVEYWRIHASKGNEING